jgi:hypothetical protein
MSGDEMTWDGMRWDGHEKCGIDRYIYIAERIVSRTSCVVIVHNTR